MDYFYWSGVPYLEDELDLNEVDSRPAHEERPSH